MYNMIINNGTAKQNNKLIDLNCNMCQCIKNDNDDNYKNYNKENDVLTGQSESSTHIRKIKCNLFWYFADFCKDIIFLMMCYYFSYIIGMKEML